MNLKEKIQSLIAASNKTTGSNRGHVIGVSDNGFTIMACEDYFIGLPCRYVAIG